MNAEQREELKQLAAEATPIYTELYGDRYFTKDYSQALLTKEQDSFVSSVTPEVVAELLDEMADAEKAYALLFAENARLRKELEALAQPAGEAEPVYQYQLANGNWIDQIKGSYEYNLRHGQATVRVLYAKAKP